MAHPLDDPRITSQLFYPRRAMPGNSRVPNAKDGTFAVDDTIKLGYRLFIPPKDPAVVLLYFHGNGEVAPDYDGIAPLYFEIGAAVLVVDYRGYGWSTGTPLTSTLLTDGDAVMAGLPALLADHALADKPLFIMGRSLGSAPAIYLAANYGDRLAGLVVESGFADTPSLFKRLGIPVDLSNMGDLPVGNVTRMAEVKVPVLVIHGENDVLLPVDNGRALYEAATVGDKTLLTIPGAGHNDILFTGMAAYMNELVKLFAKAIP